MKKTKKNIVGQVPLKNEFFETSTFLYVLLMFTLFLVYCTNGYCDIQDDRLNFFTFTTLGLLFMFIISLPLHFTLIKNIKGYIFKGNILKSVKNTLKALSITDYSITFLLVSCIISTCFSSYQKESLTGGYGRSMGLKTYLLIFIMYFLVSRGLKFKNFAILVLLITSNFMFVLALSQRLGCDFFGLYLNIQKIQQPMFVSTIGNTDFFSSFVMLVLPISACLFCICENALSKAIYLISVIMSFIALIIANSDSGYAAAIIMFILLGIYSFRNLKILKRYIMVILSFLISCKIIFILFLLNRCNVSTLGTISEFFVDSNKIYILLLISLALLFLINYFELKKYQIQKILIISRVSFIAITAITIIIIASLMIWFSCFETTKNLGIFEKTLRVNNQWGTGRGYIFWLAINSYLKYDPFQKLFGYGMDMFQIVIKNYLNYIPNSSKKLVLIDSAHNELLSYLVSTGIIGCVSYIIFVVSQILKSLRNCAKEPILLVFAVCLSCYFIQSLANIAVPMVAPLFFLLIAISESINREKSVRNHLGF